jgi:hypothetical protein
MTSAQKAYKDAYDAGNGDELLKAQEALTTAKIRADKLSQIKIPPLQQPTGDVQPQQQAPVAPPQQPPQQLDPRVKTWADENTWFGTDDEMTSFALGFHNKLVNKGVDPSSDDYYEQVNARMRQVFPENFEDIDPVTEIPSKPANVVAAATRTVAPKKVKLTKTQVSIAKRLGVPLEDYAKQVAIEMRKGNG